MKAKYDPWARLCRAARPAGAGPEATVPAPFGFDTRVLADWRAETSSDEWLLWKPALRGALVTAGLVAILSVGLSYFSQPEDDQSELAIADSVITMTMNR